MKPDPLDNPTRNAATSRNLINGMRAIHVQPWLEEISFDRLVEAWWAAQARKADELDRAGLRSGTAFGREMRQPNDATL